MHFLCGSPSFRGHFGSPHMLHVTFSSELTSWSLSSEPSTVLESFANSRSSIEGSSACSSTFSSMLSLTDSGCIVIVGSTGLLVSLFFGV